MHFYTEQSKSHPIFYTRAGGQLETQKILFPHKKERMKYLVITFRRYINR